MRGFKSHFAQQQFTFFFSFLFCWFGLFLQKQELVFLLGLQKDAKNRKNILFGACLLFLAHNSFQKQEKALPAQIIYFLDSFNYFILTVF